MNCDSVTKLIPLYFYGEITPDEEDQVDQHLHECAACATQMEQQRMLASALDQRSLDTPSALLDECRDDLMAAVAGGAPRPVKSAKGPWTLFLEAFGATFAGFGRLRQPVAALLLVLLGYAGARFSGAGGATVTPLASDNVYPTVLSVKSENDGRVRIQLDETRRQEVTGRLEDPNIQRLLLAGSRDENPAVRVESVALMKNRADSPQVLESLLNTLSADPNDGVRLKALDALKPVSGDPRVLKTLSQVLLNDANPAVRMQVIDMMMTRRDDSMVGVLQNLIEREDNSGVRLKASKALKDWNASIGTF
jgi:HEAT repeats/Putative zinc-finger